MTSFFKSYGELKNSISAKPIGDDGGLSGVTATLVGDSDSGFDVSAVLPMVVNSELAGAKSGFTVYLIYNKNGFSMSASNDFLHGVIPAGEARKAVKDAISKDDVTGRTVKSFMDNYSKHQNWAFIDKDTSSNEFQSSKNGLFATAIGSYSDERVNSLVDFYRDLCPMVASDLGDDFIELLSRYAFKKSIMIEGDHGSGKTHLALTFAKDYNSHLLQGHDSIEPVDMIGYLMPVINEDGVEVKAWKDGPLTAAFRDASKNIKTVLIVDEILRIRSRERSAFTAALAPDPDGYYTLVTDRAVNIQDGIVQSEVLKAHKSNLCVIGTTNIGADYDVDSIEPAFGDRFWRLRRDTTPEMIKGIVFKVGKELGYSDAVLSALFDFYSGLCKFVLGGKLNTEPNLRHFIDIMELAGGEGNLKREVIQALPMWCGRGFNGRLIEDEVELVTMLADDLL